MVSRKTIIFLLFLFISAFTAQAATYPNVIVNEIAWMGTKATEVDSKNWWRHEWLEFYNNTDRKVSLNGWKIELYRDSLDWSLELNGDIPAWGYFLIVSSEKISPAYDINYSNLGGKFNNAGQRVILRDNTGKIADEINCSSGWFAGNNATKQTMERINALSDGSLPENWRTSQNPGGTPRAENDLPAEAPPQPTASPETTLSPTPSPLIPLLLKPEAEKLKTPYPTSIIINEILPSPSGPDEQEEWIEIANQNNFEVDLSGWQITDTAGKTTTYIFPTGTKVQPLGFLVLKRPLTKIILNNEGDGLKLLQPDETMIDVSTYQKAPQNQSWARSESGAWAWSVTLTPGSMNITAQPLEPTGEEKNLKEAQQASEEESKEFQGGLDSIKKQNPKPSYPLFVFLIALTTAILSGIIISIIKRKIKNRVDYIT